MLSTIYLDNQATTPADPRVREAMLRFLELEAVGNPHSEHVAGRRVAAAVEQAREQVATLIGAQPDEIVFTSGATEANNIALQGVARSARRRGDHIVTCATEHKCVLETVAFLGRGGFRVDVLPVGEDGIVSPVRIAEAIAPDTALVSIMAANNEIGVLQPIEEIASICQSRGVVFHSDAAQAAGKISLDVKALDIDLMGISAHKLYAPIGVGALYVSSDSPVVPEPLFWGGGQERGVRSGTVAAHLCIAFGAACAIAATEFANDASRSAMLRDRFLAIIRAAFPDVRVNAARAPRLPGNLSLTFPGVDADRLVGAVQPRLAISSNAACSAGVLQPSHVLIALGLSEKDADSTVRIGFGRFNTALEVDAAAELLAQAALRIRRGETLDHFAA